MKCILITKTIRVLTWNLASFKTDKFVFILKIYLKERRTRENIILVTLRKMGRGVFMNFQEIYVYKDCMIFK